MNPTRLAVALALVSFPFVASAYDGPIHLELGAGSSFITTMGDGIWQQQGAPSNSVHTTTPTFLAGLTGPIYSHGPWSLRYHLDYVYLGEYSASCYCTSDANYDNKRHVVLNPSSPDWGHFNGHGHLQGIPLTLDLGYTYRTYRFALEGGVWAYSQTWHESLYTTDPSNGLNVHEEHHIQFGYVVGARIESGPWSVAYRYYQVRPNWGSQGYPGLAKGAHTVTFNYRF